MPVTDTTSCGSGPSLSLDAALSAAGVGAFQLRLLALFGLVWAADAMQVLAIGFAAPSIAGEFGLPVAQAVQGGTAFFVGMLIGAWGFGQLADRFGRRRVLIGTVLMDGLFGLLSAAAPNFSVLLALRFLVGAAVGGTLPVDYAMMAEFLPASRRGRWLVGLESFWAVGTLALALTSALAAAHAPAMAWRFIFATAALPALIGLWFRPWLPESPAYLARTGRPLQALDVLDRVALANGRSRLAASVMTDETQPPARPAAVFAGDLRRPSLLILPVWLLVSVSYYGVFVWLPSHLASLGHGFLRGQGFLVLLALAQLPGYALAAFGVERWGRRATLIGFLSLAAISCALFVAASSAFLLAAALLLMSFAFLGAWGALYAFTPEIYPTRLRATGMGLAGAMARLGGLLAPSALAGIMLVSFGAAIALFAVLLALAALAVYAIKIETRGVPLN
jgi:MFS transporter, putative metabolite:H+ symporter